MQPLDLNQGDNRALKDIILARIRSAGPISFAEYIELALYHPDHGYYLTSDPSLDYQSSPNVHPVFGACIARRLAAYWRAMGRPARFEVVEAGAGDGRLAADILTCLERGEPDLHAAIRYVIQDRAYAVPRRRADLERSALPWDKLSLATALPPAGSVEGCILSNELLDALPLHRVRVREGRLHELRVGAAGGSFVDVESEACPTLEAYFAALDLLPGEGCVAEVNLQAPAWLAAAAASLRRGFLVTLDYGYEASTLYASWRKRGTLLTFYRHTSGDNPYIRIGRQDITASVDFTTVRRAGEAAGLTVLGLMPQASFLAALDIAGALSRQPAADQLEAYYALRRAVIELTDSSGLGRIQALELAKGVALDPG